MDEMLMEERKKNTILIVDDEKSNIMTLTHILSPSYTIYASRDGQDAIEVAHEYIPDIILLDILMPGMDGYCVIEALKNSEKTRLIPVIFITGLSSDDDEKKGLSLGAADYISKPFNQAIVELRVKIQLKIINQMRALDKQFKQQILMASISQNFLTNTNKSAIFSNTLRMIGEFMEVAQVLLFILKEDRLTLTCNNEWISPKFGMQSRIGECIPLKEPMISITKNIKPGIGKNACLHSNDPSFRAAMRPYRVNFTNYITTPIFIKGTICGIIDFSKENDTREWSESEINLATHVASIFSGVYEREDMERTILAQALTEKSRKAKSEFLSRMSHEMRTPMNAIIGMTYLARNADDRSKINEYLAKSDNASHHLLQLIDHVLDISSIEDNKLILSDTEFNIDAMLKQLFKELDTEINVKQHSFSFEKDPAIPETLIGDRNRLYQVISSLLSNAIKFTPDHGSIKLKISGLKSDKEMLPLQFEVIDNGIGIPKEQKDKIFTLFEQADGGIDRKFAGVGSGLYLSKHIAGLMGGEISIDSEPGKGSRFIFTAKLKIKAINIDSNASLSFKGKTALLAEDVEVNREIIIALLEETEIKIECATNGREALELFTAHPDKFDIIMMDINMPVMDGIEATRQIRSLETPKGKEVPIIAVTANVLPEDVTEYIKAGMNDYVSKPVDFDILVHMLYKYLK
ncbi:MAG: response regulator [Spirochaetaceae bacterium]|nr:response regulator [Spirochaetaceae bacterium]